MKTMIRFSLLLLVSGLAGAAEISLGTYCFGGMPDCDAVEIPDNGPALTGTITGSGLPTSSILGRDLIIRLFGLEHPYAGDLVVEIRRVLGGIVEPVFYRINNPDPSDPLNFGSGADFSTGFGTKGYYEFRYLAVANIWDASLLLGDTDFIDPDVSYAPSGVSIGTPIEWSLFDGSDPNTTWEIRIRDLASGEVGSIQGWSLLLNVAEVPEPSTFGLALGAMAALWIGRRHRAQR